LPGLDQRREYVAVVITTDGRRVPVRFDDVAPENVSILRRLGLIGLGLLALITGSGRESGGRRR
jgi:hypothetical protein